MGVLPLSNLSLDRSQPAHVWRLTTVRSPSRRSPGEGRDRFFAGDSVFP